MAALRVALERSLNAPPPDAAGDGARGEGSDDESGKEAAGSAGPGGKPRGGVADAKDGGHDAMRWPNAGCTPGGYRLRGVASWRQLPVSADARRQKVLERRAERMKERLEAIAKTVGEKEARREELYAARMMGSGVQPMGVAAGRKEVGGASVQAGVAIGH